MSTAHKGPWGEVRKEADVDASASLAALLLAFIHSANIFEYVLCSSTVLESSFQVDGS
jgi:hypothetical protein